MSWQTTPIPEYVAAASFRHLRLVDPDQVGQGRRPGKASLSQNHPRVLLAGSDETRRQKLRQELRRTLEPGTVFVETSKAWEVVQQAPDSRMVMLTGDLPEASAESITRVLGRRYPGLPVLRLDEVPILDAALDQHEAGSARV